MHNFEDIATHIRAANNPEGADWDPLKLAPDGQPGWWSNGGVEPAGRIFLWGVTNSSDVANLGLVPADLCRADGTGCVAPSTTSVTTALAGAKADGTGLVHVNPAAAGAGAYPLVSVTYAAVRTAQSLDALHDYAQLIVFAAGSGQTPGVQPGQLPRGYLPLADGLRARARSVGAKLMALANPMPGPALTFTTRPPGPPPPTIVVTSPGPEPLGYTTTRINAVPERFTPFLPLGPVRWGLLAIVVVGLLGAAGGPAFRVIGRRMVLRRWRT